MTDRSNLIYLILLPIFFSKTCEAIKCFDCSSSNNSACLDLNLQKMHAIVPVVDCAKSMPNTISKHFFCRKITQTIFHDVNAAPDVRVLRGCGWVKHKRECYTADNKDHLETVCQCFGDLCNAASALRDVKLTAAAILAAMLVSYRSWRENV